MSEKAEQQREADELETVVPDLRDDYKRLQAIMRGNVSREQQLRKLRNREMDLAAMVLAKLDTLVEQLMGVAQTSPERLAFEIKFAEQVRSFLDRALLTS